MNSPVSDETRRAIEHDCIRLMHRYAINADQHNDRFTDVFTPDVVWIRPGMEMRGHAAMQAFIDETIAALRARNPAGPLTRHVITSIDIRVIDEDHAQGVTYGLVFRDNDFSGTLPTPMNTLELVVEYRDEFVRTAAGWLISRHEAEHTFRR